MDKIVRQIGNKSILSVDIDYHELVDSKKGSLIIQNLVSKAEQNNNTSISITVLNKESVAETVNAGKLTFVKEGKESPNFQSFVYNHEDYGEGRLYQTSRNALLANNISRNHYYHGLMKGTIIVIVTLSINEVISLGGNPFDVGQIKEPFPLAILHGSLLADGGLSPQVLHPSFKLTQTASLQTLKTGKEHISYLLFVFSQIPPTYFSSKPFSLYTQKDLTWHFRLTTRSFPLLNSYYKTFYPKGSCSSSGTKRSGFKEFPPLKYLKTIIDYNALAHFILQDGSVYDWEICLWPCPQSYKGSTRIALALTESLKIPCYVKLGKNAEGN